MDEDAEREAREEAALKRYYAGAAGAEDEFGCCWAGAEDEFEACFTESWEWDGSGVIFISEGGEACDDGLDTPDLLITVKRVMLLSSVP